jgi:endonuclease III
VYGSPASPPTSDPFGLVVWENVVYPADDAARAAAFARLRQQVGLTPEAILATEPETLQAVSSGGILAEHQADKLRTTARLVSKQFGGHLSAALQGLSAQQARRALRQFPSIGEPGADKILLFAGLFAVAALDSNGVRVLTRLGLADEQRDYAKTYRSAVSALAAELQDFEALWRAYVLLRQHGQELCRRSTPRCAACPLTQGCAYYQSHAH